MGYVFGKAFWWILTALVFGGVIGYFWNGWRRSKWVDSTTSSLASSATTDETKHLRDRIANLESVVPERDRLKARVAELEAELRDCRSSVTASAASSTPPPGATQGFAAVDTERDGSAGEAVTASAAVPDANPTDTSVNRLAGVDFDGDHAARVLGKRVKHDDLKVVEGIGPKIEELCDAGGIATWAGLAATPVSRLQEILAAGGERFRMHDPATWPRQAELLSLGKWEEFKQLTDELSGGRA